MVAGKPEEGFYPELFPMDFGERLERLENGRQVGKVCEPCKVHGVRWAENRILKLEAEAGEVRFGSNQLERASADRSADGTERDWTRCRNSAQRRRSEATGWGMRCVSCAGLLGD